MRRRPVPTTGSRPTPGAFVVKTLCLLLLTLVEWKSDTYKNTALGYDVTLEVRDAQGNELASCRRSGKDDLGGSFWNPVGHANRAVPTAFAAKLGELLSDPGILAALQ